jgi:hypothetical protein
MLVISKLNVIVDVVTEETQGIDDCRLFQVNLYMLAIFFIKDIHDLANFP